MLYKSIEPVNSIGNIVNNSFIYFHNGLIFYSDKQNDNKLCVWNIRTNEKKFIDDKICMNINVCNNRIYYTNNLGLFSCDFNGDDKICLVYNSSIFTPNIVEGWIYFSEHRNVKNYAIYKMKIDGTNKTLLSYNGSVCLVVSEGWVYYTNYNDSSKIYKMKLDGTCETIVTNDAARSINVNGIWVYYSNLDDGGKIYKISGNGTNKIKLNDVDTVCLNYYEDYIYYRVLRENDEYNGSMYSIFAGEIHEIDGNIFINVDVPHYDISDYIKPKLITKNKYSYVNIYDSYLFCKNNLNLFYIHLYNLDYDDELFPIHQFPDDY
jgi:hypothetical protein